MPQTSSIGYFSLRRGRTLSGERGSAEAREIERLACAVADGGVSLDATSSHRLSPVAMPFITERPKFSSVSNRRDTFVAPPSLICESTTSALPIGVHALSLHPAAEKSTSHAKAVQEFAEEGTFQRNRKRKGNWLASSPAARFAHSRGVARHPDRDRASLPLSVVAPDSRADNLDRCVCCSEGIDQHTVRADTGRLISNRLQQVAVPSVDGIALGGNQRDLVVVVRYALRVGINSNRVGAGRCERKRGIRGTDACTGTTRRR